MSGLASMRADRRRFVKALTAGGALPLLQPWLEVGAALPGPEVETVRLVHTPAMCLAPQYLAEPLLMAEGFDKVEYVSNEPQTRNYSQVSLPNLIANGMADVSMAGAPGVVATVAGGGPLTVVGGVHAGCYELFARESILAVRELRNRAIAITPLGEEKLFVASMLAYVGINPLRDVQWVLAESPSHAVLLFLEGKVDACLGFPPQAQEMRRRGAGRLLLSTVSDRPWSQYFCCVVAANRSFVNRYPIATKRALRALLMAADICASEPARAARYMVERGHVADYQDAVKLVTDLPYRRWRDADPEDTLRFHALRLYDVGMIHATPKEVLTDGTDWRFFRELRRELKV